MGLDFHSILLRRDCSAGSDSSDCEKPVSKTLMNVVPTAILGFVVVTSLVVLVVLSRRRKRLDAMEDAKARRNNIEIDDYEPPTRPGGGKQPPVRMVPVSQRGRKPPQLTVPPPTASTGREPSPTPRMLEDEFDKSPYYHANLDPAPKPEPEISPESIAKMAQTERHII
ncbi:hypothetical protein Plec18167_007451 [Paecilomyces lecythidis]|uniref:Uncharacterized protein n=1 Tax=Paecilomyces lecythidis TaxID=3004212 RepID=A0ABR3X338_9EURO